MTDNTNEGELQRAKAEADAAEAKVRQMKESLIPRALADALPDLLRAEVSAMLESQAREYLPRLHAATTDEEQHAAFEALRAAWLAGLDRVLSTMKDQTKAWTVAGIEDRTGRPWNDQN